MTDHQNPTGDCLVCYEELTSDNYMEYRVGPSSPWLPGKFCVDCTQAVLDTKFEAYVTGVANSTCAAEVRRYMLKGPPIYIEDSTGFPVGEGEHVDELWYSRDNGVHTAKVKGALEGEARQRLWDEQKQFAVDLPAEDPSSH